MIQQALAGAVAASAALAASAAIPPAYLAHLPPAQVSANGVEYLTGGKDRLEADSVKRAAQEFPLELVFTEHDSGARRDLYDNPVVIRDDTGKVVFAGRTDGPYFLARLPEGHYSVTTHWDSWSFTRPVTIAPDQRTRVVFAWDKPSAARQASSARNG